MTSTSLPWAVHWYCLVCITSRPVTTPGQLCLAAFAIMQRLNVRLAEASLAWDGRWLPHLFRMAGFVLNEHWTSLTMFHVYKYIWSASPYSTKISYNNFPNSRSKFDDPDINICVLNNGNRTPSETLLTSCQLPWFIHLPMLLDGQANAWTWPVAAQAPCG